MKRHLVLTILTLLTMVTFTAASVFADDGDGAQQTKLQMNLKATGGDATVTLNETDVDGTRYFFLPAGVKEENVVPAFTDPDDQKCQTMQSANVASIHFFSEDPQAKGRDYIHASRDNKAPGKVYMFDENFRLLYEGNVDAIKGRGNATWYNTDKKGYQIKLKKKADLLDPAEGSQKAKKWVLLANAYDPTLIRNNVIYAFSKEIGLDNSSEGRPVDLYYDGDYRGAYYLCEKVEIGENRVEINDLEKKIEDANLDTDFDALEEIQTTNSHGNEVKYEKGITDPEDITGGYLLEVDSVYYQPEKSWFSYYPGEAIVSNSPEYLSENMMEYISGLFTDMHDYVVEQAGSFGNGRDIFNYIDKETFARYFIVNELMDVQDAYVSSTFFYKPQGEDKFYAGPVWDCDSSMRLRFEDKRTVGWMRGQFSQRLLQLPAFRKAVQEIYASEVRPVVYDILLGEKEGSYLKPIMTTKEEMAASVKMNYMIWDINNNGGNFHPSGTVESNYEDMLNWIPARLAWFDQTVMAEDFASNKVDIGKAKSLTADVNSEAKSCRIAFAKATASVNNIIKGKVLDEIDYEVSFRKSTADAWTTQLTGGALSWEISGLEEGTDYVAKVRAVITLDGEAYYGDDSDMIKFRVDATATEPETPVQPPADPEEPPTQPQEPQTAPAEPAPDPAEPTEPATAPAADPAKQMGADGTALGEGASDAAADKAITSMKNDNDPKGSVFSVLKLRSTKQAKNSLTLNWSKAKGARKYVIYGNRCGKANKMKKIATAKTNKYVVKKIFNNKGKKVNVAKGKYYKFIVVALDRNNNVVSTSKVIHTAAAGTKAGNYKGISVSRNVIKSAKKLRKGKSLKLSARPVPTAGKKVSKHVGLRYETTNKKIATVSSKGVVKAKSKGTCYINIFTQNGVFKTVKVVVK